jgi:hypothetical protein
VTWQQFVASQGRNTRADHLAAIVQQPVDAVRAVRRQVQPTGPRRTFADLFAAWNGRPPADEDWPVPRKIGGGYEWLAPELALLARLVGTVDKATIARTLTERLQRVTGDPRAVRNETMVLIGMNRAGLQAQDVIGGLTVTQAKREIRANAVLEHELRYGRLKYFWVGRLRVIPHAEWERWKAGRTFAPKGWWRLAQLKKALGIKSDKLSEWARLGYVPSAVRVNGYGFGHSTKWGCWYIEPKVGKKLLADRRAGRPMPWWGKPEPCNLRITWRLLQQRKHPADCQTCRDIWGPAGAPTTYDDYAQRYPPLAHGAKRHLTRPWTPGLTVAELALETGRHVNGITRAIKAGVLRASKMNGRYFITRTDATRWKGRHCTLGGSHRSWMSVGSACKAYGFAKRELLQHITDQRLRSKTGTLGAMNGIVYVLKQQVRELRDELGFSEREAARRVGVSVARLRVLLRGVEWRPAPRIPADVVRTCQRRAESQHGVTIAEAAKMLRKPVRWVRAEIVAGTVRPLRTKWDRKRLYISLPMFTRLYAAVEYPRARDCWSSAWLFLSEAATYAGVTTGTIGKWLAAGDLKTRKHPAGTRFHRRSLEARARKYWREENRFKRATPPAWLQEAA